MVIWRLISIYVRHLISNPCMYLQLLRWYEAAVVSVDHILKITFYWCDAHFFHSRNVEWGSGRRALWQDSISGQAGHLGVLPSPGVAYRPRWEESAEVGRVFWTVWADYVYGLASEHLERYRVFHLSHFFLM